MFCGSSEEKKKNNTNIPLESAVCSPAEDVSWGGDVLIQRRKKNKQKKPDVASNSPVLALEHAKLNDNASAQVK